MSAIPGLVLARTTLPFSFKNFGARQAVTFVVAKVSRLRGAVLACMWQKCLWKNTAGKFGRNLLAGTKGQALLFRFRLPALLRCLPTRWEKGEKEWRCRND